MEEHHESPDRRQDPPGRRGLHRRDHLEGQSVRLIAADAATNEHVGLEYNVGEVWEVEAAAPEHVIPPHVENIVVQAKRRLGPMSKPHEFIERHMPPKMGGPELLYEGLAQVATTGALYIAEQSGIPPYSTLFWRPDQPLTRTKTASACATATPAPDGGCTLTFVGFQEPVEVIPAGALVRVSLAHWWRPDDHPDDEPRCYVQLSGYFLPIQPDAAARPSMPRAAADHGEISPRVMLRSAEASGVTPAERPFGASGQGDKQIPAAPLFSLLSLPPPLPKPSSNPSLATTSSGPCKPRSSTTCWRGAIRWPSCRRAAASRCATSCRR